MIYSLLKVAQVFVGDNTNSKIQWNQAPLSAKRSLAQLVAHPLDVREVTSSSLVSSTTETWTKSSGFFLFLHFPPLLRPKSSQIEKWRKSSNHAKVMAHSKMVTFSAFSASKSYLKTALQVFCLYRGSYGLLFKFCRTSIWLPNNFDLTFYSSERACM